VVELSQFLPRLMPYVLGVSEPLAIQALRDSAIRFCTDSNVVSTTLDPLTTIVAVPTYELEAPDAYTVVSTVLKVWYDGKIIPSVPYDTATGMYSTSPGAPRFFFGEMVDEVFSLTLMPTPDVTKANSLRVRVALKPTRTTTKVHDVLYDRYIEGIVNGAISILCAVPDQPYTDFGRAAAAGVAARALTNRARADTMHGNVQSSLSVQMRAF
jgi:hypothetical protein